MTTKSHTQRRLNTIRTLAIRLRRRREAGKLPGRLAAEIILLILILLAAFAWPFTKCHLQAVAVLDLIANQPVPTFIRATALEPITTTDITIPTPGGPVRARLYTPTKHPNAPALVVLHGVHHLGMDEPRLIAFASAMASCGIRVLTPELPGIKDYHVGANSITTIGDSATWLSEYSRPPYDRNAVYTRPSFQPVGVMGLSFSGGLSLLAAAAPAYKPHIKFVVAVGSQDEMSRIAAYYRTGQDLRPTGPPEHLAPHEYGALVMEYSNLEDFAPSEDQNAIRAVLRAHLYEDPTAEQAALAALTPKQLAEAKQLMDTTSPITRALLAKAETKHIADMAGVSPHGHLATLTTPVYLLHGEADNIIPSAETQWMEAELPSETLQASLISPVISHLDMDGKGPTTLDRLRLVHFFALVLRASEKR